MRTSLSSILLLFLLVAGLSGCGAEFIENPIMTAVVNGKKFTACRGSGKNIAMPTNNVEITYNDTDGRLVIKGSDSCNDTIKHINFDIRDVQGTGTYILDHSFIPAGSTGNFGTLSFPYFRPMDLQGVLTTSSQHTGRFILTDFDLQKRRLSATFEMDVFEPKSGIHYRIREGKLQDAPF